MIGIAGMVLAVLALEASATIIASESFSTGNGSDYTSNSSFSSAENKSITTGTTGFTDDWSIGTSLIVPRSQGSLSAIANFDYSVVNGAIGGVAWNKSYTDDRASRRAIASAPVSGTTVYMSTMVMRPAVTALDTNEVATVGFGTTSGVLSYSINEGIHAGIQLDSSGNYRLVAGVGGTLFDLGAANYQKSDQIIVKMTLNDSGNETVSIGLVADGTGTLNWLFENQSVESWSSTADMNALVIQLDGVDSLSSNGILFDEVRLGTTLGDVTNIPEPATIGMLGIGALITMLLRRRLR